MSSDSDSSPSFDYVAVLIGSGIVVIGGVMDNFGVTLQKLSFSISNAEQAFHALSCCFCKSCCKGMYKYRNKSENDALESYPEESESFSCTECCCGIVSDTYRTHAKHKASLMSQHKSRSLEEDVVIEYADVNHQSDNQNTNNPHSSGETSKNSRFNASTVMWWCGLFLYLLGNLLNAVGLGLTPQSVFAALGSVNLIANTINSAIFQKEKITSCTLFGTLFIMVGSSGAVAFGSHDNSTYTLQDLGRSVKPAFIAYICMVVFCLICLRYSIGESLPHLDFTKVVSVRSRGSLIDAPEEQHFLVHEQDSCVQSQDSLRKLHTRRVSFTLPIFAGMWASVTLLFVKMSLELGKSAVGSNSGSFLHYETYIILITMIVMGCFQISYINWSLKYVDQLIAVPTFSVTMEVFSILEGIIYFREYRSFTTRQFIMFPLSIIATFIGVYVTTLGQVSLYQVNTNHQSTHRDSRHADSGQPPLKPIEGKFEDESKPIDVLDADIHHSFNEAQK